MQNTVATTSGAVSHKIQILGSRRTEDWNAVYLSTNRLEAHVRKNRRREELQDVRNWLKVGYTLFAYRHGVAIVDDAKVHQDAQIHLPIREDPLVCSFVEAVHFRIGDIGCEPCDQQFFLARVEELAGLWPGSSIRLVKVSTDITNTTVASGLGIGVDGRTSPR